LRPSSPGSQQRRRSASESIAAQYALPFVIETPNIGPETPPQIPESSVHPAAPVERSQPIAQSVERDLKVLHTYGQKRPNGTARRPTGAAIAPDAKLLVSRNVAAEMLSISVRGVDYMIARRQLSTRRIANRVLIPTEEVRKFARSDHPGRMAGSLSGKVNQPNRAEAQNRATRELEDELRLASRSRKRPSVEMAYVDHRYRKPTRTADSGALRGDWPESVGTG